MKKRIESAISNTAQSLGTRSFREKLMKKRIESLVFFFRVLANVSPFQRKAHEKED